MDDELASALQKFQEAAQTIADKLPDHLKSDKVCLRARFPWGVIRPLRSHYTRWPYLAYERKRTVACTIQLCDINRWNLNIWNIGLTAGSVWEWHCTIPVIAVSETLCHEYGRQFGLINEDATFKKVIDTLQSKGIISAKLRTQLHMLREYRNGIHLYLQNKVELHDGKLRKYNDAVRALRNLERALRDHHANPR